MNPIEAIRKYPERFPDEPSPKALTRLITALAEERSYSLAELYATDYEAFEIAPDLLKDWRVDRYHAARLKLFDFALSAVLVDAEASTACCAATSTMPMSAASTGCSTATAAIGSKA